MSGIGSVGSTSAAQYLKKLSGSSSCSQTDDDSQADDDLNQDIQAAGGTIDFQDLRSQIEAAVKIALSGATSSSDPSTFLSTVKDAIGKTLEANGIDPSKLKGALESQFGQAGGPAGAGGPPAGPPLAGGPHGAKKEGQDLLSLLDSLDDQDDTTSTVDALLGTSSTSSDGTSTGSSTDLGSILDAADSSSDSSSSDPFGIGSTSSTDDLLSQLYSQLFQNFPNGSGIDTVV